MLSASLTLIGLLNCRTLPSFLRITNFVAGFDQAQILSGRVQRHYSGQIRTAQIVAPEHAIETVSRAHRKRQFRARQNGIRQFVWPAGADEIGLAWFAVAIVASPGRFSAGSE